MVCDIACVIGCVSRDACLGSILQYFRGDVTNETV